MFPHICTALSHRRRKDAGLHSSKHICIPSTSSNDDESEGNSEDSNNLYPLRCACGHISTSDGALLDHLTVCRARGRGGPGNIHDMIEDAVDDCHPIGGMSPIATHTDQINLDHNILRRVVRRGSVEDVLQTPNVADMSIRIVQNPDTPQPDPSMCADYRVLQREHALRIAEIKSKATMRYWQLVRPLRHCSMKTQTNVVRVIRGQFLDTGDRVRKYPYPRNLRDQARSIISRVMSDPNIMCHGEIDLAHHCIEGLQNIHVTFIHPIWAWITVVNNYLCPISQQFSYKLSCTLAQFH